MALRPLEGFDRKSMEAFGTLGWRSLEGLEGHLDESTEGVGGNTASGGPAHEASKDHGLY